MPPLSVFHQQLYLIAGHSFPCTSEGDAVQDTALSEGEGLSKPARPPPPPGSAALLDASQACRRSGQKPPPQELEWGLAGAPTVLLSPRR